MVIFKKNDGKIGVIGFEPTASCSQSRRSSQAELHPGKLTAELNMTFYLKQTTIQAANVKKSSVIKICNGQEF